MKSSYKLYGSFWDGRSLPRANIAVQCGTDKLNENIIELSKVLSVEQPEKYKIIKKESTYLWVDYFPSKKSVVFMEFFVKRLLQIAEYYNVSMIACNNQDEVDVIEKIYADFCKRKAPDKLLAQSHGAFQMIC